jgi:hydroxyacylglutathione hydrolase
MDIERIWVGNSGRNFNYLVACSETGDALVVDPLDSEAVLAAAGRNGWRITQIVNTHEHGDHTAGNAAVVSATGARVLAHSENLGRIPGVDVGLKDRDEVTVGKSVRFRVLDTPGHTLAHVCLFSGGDMPVLFCGDTMFNAGAGNCHMGGQPLQLFKTFSDILVALPAATRIYPGHEYLSRNLAFTMDREPSNTYAAMLLEEAKSRDPARAPIMTIAQESRINTFFRLEETEIVDGLSKSVPGFPESPVPSDVFLALRKLRDSW